MNIQETITQIKKISSKTEELYLKLGEQFPTLLTKTSSKSLDNLKNMLEQLKVLNNNSSKKEGALFDSYAEKYNPLFERLNMKIEDLSKLNNMIVDIKEDSEQMELIALNAMVISIKSGEKGQAFSRITENLQRLSNDMFTYSDKLIEEEKLLIDHINNLKSIFSGIIQAQKALSDKGSSGSSSITSFINGLEDPITVLEAHVESIYKPIQKAMEGLQLQDMIRQAIEHVEACLAEIHEDHTSIPVCEEALDCVTFNIELYQLASEVLDDVNNYVKQSLDIFNENWMSVIDLLDSIENEKMDFESRYLNDFKPTEENIKLQMSKIISSFKHMIDGFSTYHYVQKDLVHVCQNITEKARTMNAVFENLRPVMSRLHHVRILQQIEVSKNDAISSVRDSVTDMDNLINSANNDLDEMEALLDSFISDTGSMIKEFTTSIADDNEKMEHIKSDKDKFFEELNICNNNLSDIIKSFDVFPDGFQSRCVTVQQALQDLRGVGDQLTELSLQMIEDSKFYKTKKDELLKERGLTSWELRNNKFADLIQNFTITAHKEAAGKIGGFEIEKGAESGDITFF